MLCAAVDNDLLDVLLERLVKSYIALRPCFCCPWIEQTKQKQKKSLQKVEVLGLVGYNSLQISV